MVPFRKVPCAEAGEKVGTSRNLSFSSFVLRNKTSTPPCVRPLAGSSAKEIICS